MNTNNTSSNAQEFVNLQKYTVLEEFMGEANKNIRLVAFLLRADEIDSWTTDFKEDQEISRKIYELQVFLNQGGIETIQAATMQFLALLGILSPSRCLYLLKLCCKNNAEFSEHAHALLAGEPGAAGDIDCDESMERRIGVVRQRLEAFHKAQLLGEIFARKRLERIIDIMGASKNGKPGY